MGKKGKLVPAEGYKWKFNCSGKDLALVRREVIFGRLIIDSTLETDFSLSGPP